MLICHGLLTCTYGIIKMFFSRCVRSLYPLLACVVIGSILVLTSGNAVAEQEVLQATIPENPSLMGNISRNFGNFAWETFVALNWPADCQTGEPLKTQNGEYPNEPNQPRVWEFYHFSEDVFLKGGKRPDLKKVIPPQCASNNIIHPLRFTEFGKNPIFASKFASKQGGRVRDILAFWLCTC